VAAFLEGRVVRPAAVLAPGGGAGYGTPAYRRTAAGILACCRRSPRPSRRPLTVAGQRRSLTDFPRPAGFALRRDRTQRPGCARPQSAAHLRDMTTGPSTR